MKQREVAIEKFNMDGFTKAILEFLGEEVSPEVHPSWAIVRVAAPGGIPEYGPEEGRSNFMEELEAGHLLFFSFSSSNMGEPIRCADGQYREIDEESDFCIGQTDCVGFLFQLKEGVLYINSAVDAGGACVAPPPSVDIQGCDVFDAGMEAFIDSFILD